ncbi:MAG: nickel pincer cofactor biosynthesis protein LarB [Angelakisella sp.]
MNRQDILELLYRVKNGEAAPEDAINRLKLSPFEDLGYAKPDYHRAVRQGVGEVIYGEGKTPEQIAGIIAKMSSDGIEDILITRMSPEAAQAVEAVARLEYYKIPRLGVAMPLATRRAVGNIVIASGGTSDMAVCEEAALTAEVLGNHVTRLYDVGVSGLQRLLSHLDILSKARVVIAVAGMEGALASVVGGLVDCPVIAVPTSVGYGANFGGVSALLSMLNSCASGVSVVNIDNGFGAGYQASMINQMKGYEK